MVQQEGQAGAPVRISQEMRDRVLSVLRASGLADDVSASDGPLDIIYMTKRPVNDRADSRQAGALSQCEITDEMIAAGVRELLSWLDGIVPVTTPSSNAKIVSAVYASMVAASPSKG